MKANCPGQRRWIFGGRQNDDPCGLNPVRRPLRLFQFDWSRGGLSRNLVDGGGYEVVFGGTIQGRFYGLAGGFWGPNGNPLVR